MPHSHPHHTTTTSHSFCVTLCPITIDIIFTQKKDLKMSVPYCECMMTHAALNLSSLLPRHHLSNFSSSPRHVLSTELRLAHCDVFSSAAVGSQTDTSVSPPLLTFPDKPCQAALLRGRYTTLIRTLSSWRDQRAEEEEGEEGSSSRFNVSHSSKWPLLTLEVLMRLTCQRCPSHPQMNYCK